MFWSYYYFIEKLLAACNLLGIYSFFLFVDRIRRGLEFSIEFPQGLFSFFPHPVRSESFHLHSGVMERTFSLFVASNSSWITGTTACITYEEHRSTNSKRLTFTLLSSDSWKYANCNITDDWKAVFPFLETTKLHSNFSNENSLRIFWNKSFEGPPKFLKENREILLDNFAKLHR